MWRTQKVVKYLTSHPQVEKVNHPSLPEHPDHALYEKYFPNGGASIFTFQIKGGREDAFRFIDNLKIFSLLANVADVKSLVIHPASTTHSQLTEEELRTWEFTRIPSVFPSAQSTLMTLSQIWSRRSSVSRRYDHGKHLYFC